MLQGLRSAADRTGSSLNQLIVAALSEALARDELTGQAESQFPGALAACPVGPRRPGGRLGASQLPAHLRPNEDLPDADTLRQAMPEFAPPLSATISADREDRF